MSKEYEMNDDDAAQVIFARCSFMQKPTVAFHFYFMHSGRIMAFRPM